MRNHPKCPRDFSQAAKLIVDIAPASRWRIANLRQGNGGKTRLHPHWTEKWHRLRSSGCRGARRSRDEAGYVRWKYDFAAGAANRPPTAQARGLLPLFGWILTAVWDECRDYSDDAGSKDETLRAICNKWCLRGLLSKTAYCQFGIFGSAPMPL